MAPSQNYKFIGFQWAWPDLGGSYHRGATAQPRGTRRCAYVAPLGGNASAELPRPVRAGFFSSAVLPPLVLEGLLKDQDEGMLLR